MPRLSCETRQPAPHRISGVISLLPFLKFTGKALLDVGASCTRFRFLKGSCALFKLHIIIHRIYIWVFPKMMVPPNHPILIGFSIIFTIHFGGKIHLFLVQHPYRRQYSNNFSLLHILTKLQKSVRYTWVASGNAASLPLKSYPLTPIGSRIVFQSHLEFRGEVLNFGGVLRQNNKSIWRNFLKQEY